MALKPKRVLKPGDPRRMSDGRTAWRKMTDDQRVRFLDFIWQEIHDQRHGLTAYSAYTKESRPTRLIAFEPLR